MNKTIENFPVGTVMMNGRYGSVTEWSTVVGYTPNHGALKLANGQSVRISNGWLASSTMWCKANADFAKLTPEQRDAACQAAKDELAKAKEELLKKRQAESDAHNAAWQALREEARKRNAVNLTNIVKVATAVGELNILSYINRRGEAATLVFTVQTGVERFGYEGKVVEVHPVEFRHSFGNCATGGSCSSVHGVTLEDCLIDLMAS